MDNRILISVIIPVYNAEKFIRQAVNSVMSQMNGNVELILVNDGSTDSSGVICDEYRMAHPDIRVIHQENGGPCVARNAGIKAAAGEYIMFLDSDDYFAPDACEEVGKVIQKYHPDCIDFGWSYINRSGEKVEHQHKLPKNVLIENDALRKMILPPLLHLCEDEAHRVYDFSCVKVFQRKIMVEHSVFFDEGRRTWEDRHFIIQYLKHCRNYYSMDRCLYYYVFMEGSLSQRYTPDYFRIMLVSFQQYVQLFADEYDFDTQYVNDYWCTAIENMIDLSLEQTTDRDLIQKNILNTLQDKQVVYWYTKRQPKDSFEKKVTDLVVSGHAEAALQLYKEKAAKKRAGQKRTAYINRIKYGLKRIIRRLLGR